MGFDTQKHWNEYFHLYHLGHGKYHLFPPDIIPPDSLRFHLFSPKRLGAILPFTRQPFVLWDARLSKFTKVHPVRGYTEWSGHADVGK